MGAFQYNSNLSNNFQAG